MRSAKVIYCLCFAILFLFPACAKKENSPEENVIKGAVVAYDAALTRMYRGLKISEMNDVATELEISKNNAILVNFVANKIYMESALLDIRFEDIEIKPENRADVRVWERWLWRHLELNTGREVKPWVTEEQNLLYHMVKDGKKGWIVDSVEFVKKG